MAKEKFNSRERSISTDSGSVEAMTNLPRLKEVLWWKPVEITWKMDGGTPLFVQTELFMPVPLTRRSTGAEKSLHHCGTLSDAMHYHSAGELL